MDLQLRRLFDLGRVELYVTFWLNMTRGVDMQEFLFLWGGGGGGGGLCTDE